MFTEEFDLIVVGAGHAGCEAALAGARMGQRTLLLTLNLDSVAMMPCNPAIGGTGKGHLVRELDALGGEMGRAIDDTFIQSRMLNTGKGPAVYSLRAQADKMAYKARMRTAVENQPRLTLRQGEVRRLIVENGEIRGVETATGSKIGCRAAVLCTGVYLKSRIIIGAVLVGGRPAGAHRRNGAHAVAAGQRLFHPPLQNRHARARGRAHGRFLEDDSAGGRFADRAVFLPDGRGAAEKPRAVLSHLHNARNARDHSRKPASCRRCIPARSRAPARATAHPSRTRWCASPTRNAIRIFMEPEGLNTVEWYVQGMSSSLPEDVQRRHVPLRARP